MLSKTEALQLLSLEVRPALGCTEPACVALCAAAAAGAVPESSILSVRIDVCPSIYKNAKSVSIPNFPYCGVDYAGALGAFIANPDASLEVFSLIDRTVSSQAIGLVQRNQVHVSIREKEKGVFVSVQVRTENHVGEAVIQGSHSNIVKVTLDHDVIQEKSLSEDPTLLLESKLGEMTVSEIIRLADSFSPDEIRFLAEGIEMNEKLAGIGLASASTSGIARALIRSRKYSMAKLSDRCVLKAIACAECRMTGLPYSIMSSAGSGNHGITVIIPVAETARSLGASMEITCKALAIAHLCNIYIKHYTGRLSPICGCGSSAATAAGIAIVWLYGGNMEQIAGLISNMAGMITGMICDGAKTGCALKIGISVETAFTCIELALNGICLGKENGIVSDSPEKTIRNIGKVSLIGMGSTDSTILKIMESD